MSKHWKYPSGKHDGLFKDLVPRWPVRTKAEFTVEQLAALEQQLKGRLATVTARGRKIPWGEA